MLIVDPRATAGGTDIYPSSIPDVFYSPGIGRVNRKQVEPVIEDLTSRSRRCSQCWCLTAGFLSLVKKRFLSDEVAEQLVIGRHQYDVVLPRVIVNSTEVNGRNISRRAGL
jgi:hypothetical protein